MDRRNNKGENRQQSRNRGNTKRKYRKVREELPQSDELIRVQAKKGQPNKFIDTGAKKLLGETAQKRIVISCLDKAIPNGLIVARVLRSKISGLAQIIKISSEKIVDKYVPTEEGLDEVTISKTLPKIEIILTKEATQEEQQEAGYEAPIEGIQDCTLDDIIKPRPKRERRNHSAPNTRNGGGRQKYNKQGSNPKRGNTKKFNSHYHKDQDKNQRGNSYRQNQSNDERPQQQRQEGGDRQYKPRNNEYNGKTNSRGGGNQGGQRQQRSNTTRDHTGDRKGNYDNRRFDDRGHDNRRGNNDDRRGNNDDRRGNNDNRNRQYDNNNRRENQYDDRVRNPNSQNVSSRSQNNQSSNRGQTRNRGRGRTQQQQQQ